MTRDEFKTQYRKFRAARSALMSGLVSSDKVKPYHGEVSTVIWEGLYKSMPPVVFNALSFSNRNLFFDSWGTSSRNHMKCNVSGLRNSYPRKDVRNHGCYRC